MIALALGGCGPRAPTSFAGPPAVTLGTGYESFVPVSDGDAVPIITGLQGGHHIWGSVQILYVDPQQVHLTFTLTLAGQSMPSSVRDDNVDLTGTSDGTTVGEHLGSAVYLPSVDQVRGMPCQWRVDATDLEGRTGSAERKITPT